MHATMYNVCVCVCILVCLHVHSIHTRYTKRVLEYWSNGRAVLVSTPNTKRAPFARRTMPMPTTTTRTHRARRHSASALRFAFAHDVLARTRLTTVVCVCISRHTYDAHPTLYKFLSVAVTVNARCKTRQLASNRIVRCNGVRTVNCAVCKCVRVSVCVSTSESVRAARMY